MTYISRAIEHVLKEYLSTFPVVALTGPRQSGKSTLIHHCCPQYTYVNFDDLAMVQRFHDDAEGFCQTYSGNTVFDEVQRVPELFLYIKRMVDADRNRYGRFVLTGSAQFTLNEKITESLAGRVGMLTLLPLQHSEIPQLTVSDLVLNGAYPELVARQYLGREAWYESYLSTYIERDVRSLIHVDSLSDFRKFVILLAARIGNLLDLSDLAKDIGTAPNTIKRWLSVLEASYLVFRLVPYYENLGKRMIKSPKIYFYDTGLVAHITGIRNQDMLWNGPLAGALYENFVIAEFLKANEHLKKRHKLFFARTSNGVEVDLIVDSGIMSKWFIEIKSSQTFKPEMLKNLKSFQVETPDIQTMLIYRGNTVEQAPPRISVYKDIDLLQKYTANP